MHTETELRDALDHSAERADSLGADRYVVTATPPPRRRLGLRVALPATVAATVLGVVTAGVVVRHESTGIGAQRHNYSAAGSTASPPTPSAKARHIPARVTVNDLFTIGAANPDYDIRDSSRAVDNAEYAGATVNGKYFQVIALPASATFDPDTRFAGAHRVRIDGVLGYYGSVVLWPANGVPDVNTNKHGEPAPALGWKTANGTWLFVTTDDGEAINAATFAAAYAQLGVTLHTGANRLPYRTGYLPAGMHLDSVGSAGANPVSDANLQAGNRSIDINVSVGDLGMTSPGSTSIYRRVGNYSVQILGTGYSRATLQRVLDTMQFADLSSGGAGWWPITQSFG
ncbi:MAG: hypothetical protein ACR2KJ_11485 [Jatrophihabitans sp.]